MKIDKRYEIRVVIVEVIKENKLCSYGDVYDSLEDFKRDKPFSPWRYGYVVFDTETGLVPAECEDWNHNVEMALQDFTKHVLSKQASTIGSTKEPINKGDIVRLIGNFPKVVTGKAIRKGHKNHWVVDINGERTEFNETRLAVIKESI